MVKFWNLNYEFHQIWLSLTLIQTQILLNVILAVDGYISDLPKLQFIEELHSLEKPWSKYIEVRGKRYILPSHEVNRNELKDYFILSSIEI